MPRGDSDRVHGRFAHGRVVEISRGILETVESSLESSFLRKTDRKTASLSAKHVAFCAGLLVSHARAVGWNGRSVIIHVALSIHYV